MKKTKQSTPNNNPPIDRLSSLPDDLISHILSFLPTKTSISTTTLAKRWRFCWTHVPTLDFDSEDLDLGTTFSSTVDAIMSSLNARNLTNFTLSCTYDDCSEDRFETKLKKCIATAVDRNVCNLDICLFKDFMLPRCVFACKSLVDLRFELCGGVSVTADISLPALKRLYLDCVQYESNESLPHLLSGCPVLEELIIDRYLPYERDMVSCFISSATIKRLTINSSYCYYVQPFVKSQVLKIDTPALRFLHLHDSMSGVVSAGEMTSLAEGDVALDCFEPFDGDVVYSRSVLEFVGRLCNVKCLKLTSRLVTVPDSTFSGLTIKFRNLTRLELAADWRCLSYFLGNADNLEVLIIYKVNVDRKRWIEPHEVPKCLLSHVRTIRNYHLECTVQECNFSRRWKYIPITIQGISRQNLKCSREFHRFNEDQSHVSLSSIEFVCLTVV